MQRVGLEHILLHLKCLKPEADPQHFIRQALEPPADDQVWSALMNLRSLGALSPNGDITQLGRLLATFPLEPHLGKMVMYAVMMGCVDPILIIVAGQSVKNPFLSPANNRQAAKEARRNLSGDVCSDHLTLVRTYNEFTAKFMTSRVEVSPLFFIFSHFFPQYLFPT